MTTPSLNTSVRWLRTRVTIPAILFICVLAGCRPSAKDFMVKSHEAFQPYVTGDIQTAKAALLAEEAVISKYEAAGTRDYDFHGAYVVTYGRLCAVHLHLGDTNQANEYFQRSIAHRKLMRSSPTAEVTMETLLQGISKLDAQFNPTWRQMR